MINIITSGLNGDRRARKTGDELGRSVVTGRGPAVVERSWHERIA